jgi:hypothetical protein
MTTKMAVADTYLYNFYYFFPPSEALCRSSTIADPHVRSKLLALKTSRTSHRPEGAASHASSQKSWLIAIL